jgi:type VI secretion system protein VasD
MTVRAWTVRTCALALVLFAAACGKKAPAPPPAAPPPPPAPPPVTIAAAPDAKVKTTLTLAAGADVNPDANGRPSPVVVRVYQLRADAMFNSADFFALYDGEQKTLGPELITRDEFVLAPSDSKTLDVTLAPDTRFIGAIAAFRDIRNAQWRVILPASKTGVRIAVERARILARSQ